MNAQKIVTMLAVLGAGLAVNKALSLAWKGVTGHEPPTGRDDGEISIGELVVFAAISGAAVAFAKTYANRSAVRWLGSGDISIKK